MPLFEQFEDDLVSELDTFDETFTGSPELPVDKVN